jgi:hypothetical protein
VRCVASVPRPRECAAASRLIRLSFLRADPAQDNGVHPESGRASQEDEFQRGIHRITQETSHPIRRTLPLGLKSAVPFGTESVLGRSYPTLKGLAIVVPPFGRSAFASIAAPEHGRSPLTVARCSPPERKKEMLADNLALIILPAFRVVAKSNFQISKRRSQCEQRYLEIIFDNHL